VTYATSPRTAFTVLKSATAGWTVGNGCFRSIAVISSFRDHLVVDRFRLEVAVGAVVIAALVIGIIAGLSPQDWAFWYAIPATMIALGLLIGKRALVGPRRGSQSVSLSLCLMSALLIVLGSWIAWEHYADTPVDMGGHIL
jgi:hypothetical protein